MTVHVLWNMIATLSGVFSAILVAVDTLYGKIHTRAYMATCSMSEQNVGVSCVRGVVHAPYPGRIISRAHTGLSYAPVHATKTYLQPEI